MHKVRYRDFNLGLQMRDGKYQFLAESRDEEFSSGWFTNALDAWVEIQTLIDAGY